MDKLTKIIVTLFVIPVSIIYGGFVVSILWKWFIAPIFLLQHLTITQAIGLSLFITYFTINKETPSEASWEILISYMLMKPTIALASGWVVYMFL